MVRLRGRIRPYAWGSRTEIARLQGRPAPSPTPEAELWLGAHPGDPSSVVGNHDERSLLDLIDADPVGALGAEVVDRYGPRLPYLLKLLAADAPLSLQAHPDATQAREGFAAEEAAGVPRDAPKRNYADPHHKPELLVAVTEVDALCGFRPVADAVKLLERLAVPEVAAVVEALRGADPERALRKAVTEIFALPAARRTEVVAHVRAASARLRDVRPEYALAADLADRYPGDVGVLVSFLLNLVRLAPGEAIYMPAGNLHAYLRGTGVEVMAASDNVLRGGLTPKHIDVGELLRVLRFVELPDPRVSPVDAGDGVVWWPTPMPDFRLARASVRGAGPPVTLPLPGAPSPRIMLCLAGEVRLADEDGTVMLHSGEAAFAPARSGAVTLAGNGEVYQASMG